MKNMNRRLHNEYAVQASFHGIKVPLRYNTDLLEKQEEAEPFDPKIAERALQQAQARVRSRYV